MNKCPKCNRYMIWSFYGWFCSCGYKPTITYTNTTGIKIKIRKLKGENE